MTKARKRVRDRSLAQTADSRRTTRLVVVDIGMARTNPLLEVWYSCKRLPAANMEDLRVKESSVFGKTH